ncbi:MAG: serine kinase [Rhizobium sp.]|nr:serine kinase [Rhizobium sp.]
MTTLVHGTAVVIGTAGIILVGPSGSGKSAMAVRLMSGARRAGQFSALLSDDQVFVEAVNGQIVATGPEAIKGLIELRGSGIGRLSTIEHAVLHFALQPLVPDSATRIPQENQSWPVTDGLSLPLHFIDKAVSDPFGWLAALIPAFPVAGSFQL